MQHQDSCLNKGSGAGQTTAAGRWGPNVSGGQPAQTRPDAGAPGARREASLQGPSLQGTHVSPHSPSSPGHLLSSSPGTSSPLRSVTESPTGSRPGDPRGVRRVPSTGGVCLGTQQEAGLTAFFHLLSTTARC